MQFPIIGDIASRTVASVDVTSTVANAIDVMLKSEHRNVVVIKGSEFYIFSVLDVLMIQSTNIPLNTTLENISLSKMKVIDRRKNILDTLEFLNYSVESICVLNFDKTLYGVVTHTDITSNIDPDTLMENFRLKDFIKMGKRMKWENKETITSTLLKEMACSSFDNVIIIEDSKPIGILTTKDIMALIKNKNNLNLPIKNYMTSPVETIQNSSSVKEAIEFIKNKKYKRVIVVDQDGKINGVISQKELISLTYSRWAILMKKYQSELIELNNILENKNREFEIIASKDSLTGLYNRYKFSELYLSSYISMIQRDNEMSLIMLDIDFFKKVNDRYGHNVGDQVLIQISHVLLRALRHIDIICRWGGEEFMALLPTASLSQATILAQKLREQVEQLEIDNVGSVTASFGVSKVIKGDTMQSVVDRADKALYLAKKSGRNCVKTELDI